MVKIEDWTQKEIAQACSFMALNDRLYEKIQSDEEGGKYAFKKSVKSKDDFKNWQTAFRKEIIESLKIQDMLEKRNEIVIVNGNSALNWDEKTHVIEHFYIKSWMDTLIPVLLSIPKNIPERGKFPAMICTHGHSMQKENLVGKKRNLLYRSTWAKDLVQMGCITLSMDQWGFGERGKPFWRKLFKRGTYDAFEGEYAHNLLQYGRTIIGLRFFDAIRSVDYLLTRDDVDITRIGIGGLSMGGSVAGGVAAIDERINMALIAGYLNIFKKWIIDLTYTHCSCMYTPGMLTLGEQYDLLSLIAPRPVCFIAGKKDKIFPIASAEKAFKEIKKAYILLNAEDNCVLDVTPSGHSWRGDIAYPFLQKHWFQ